MSFGSHQVLFKRWLEGPGRFAFRVVEDAGTVTLLEVECGKQLTFSWQHVVQAQERRTPSTGSKYIQVLLEDGRNFSVSGVGLVFAPDFKSTGPLGECPATMCFRDFARLQRHLDHLITDDHEGHEAEALQVFMVLLASLDGARAIGLSVDQEERALESRLKQLEALGVA